ncbi:MAG: hypothetical protein M3445_02080, partial [Actinomycetota bacterium]|nr:hypothetical protein [Actinomycetota bacterium]
HRSSTELGTSSRQVVLGHVLRVARGDGAGGLRRSVQYLVNWSPARDVQILGRTLWVVAGRKA